jgi:hypothetical protein
MTIEDATQTHWEHTGYQFPSWVKKLCNFGKAAMGPRGAIHVNHLQAPCGAFLQWDLSWREHVNVTYSYVDSTRFWILTCSSCGLQYGSM